MQRRILIISSIIVLILLCLFLIYWRFWRTLEVAAVDDAFETTVNTAVANNVLANDTPADELTVTIPPQTPPTNGNVNLQPTGVFTYTPALDFWGSDTFTYQACLTSTPGQCDTATVTISVTVGVNAVDDVVTTPKNTPASGNVLTNDFPSGQLTVTPIMTTTQVNGTFELLSTGVFTYTPAADYEGPDEATYQACLTADLNNCDTATVMITVGGVDAVDDSVTTAINTPVSGNVLTNDLSSEPITAVPTPITPPSNGTFILAENGDFTYTPNNDYVGSDSVTYQACLVSDPGVCDTAAVAIQVFVDAVDDAYETEKNKPVSGNVLTNDLPTGELTASSTEFDLNANGVFTFTPTLDFTGAVTFNYQACLISDAANCDTAVVTITVEDGLVKHVVQQGEWLLQIARCYGTSPESIVYANYIPYPSWIMTGEVFVIPQVGDVSVPFNDGDCIIWYTVKAGDTLASVAAEYTVDLDMLVKANYGCYGYYSYYPYGGYYGYGYGYHSPYIYSGCYFYGVPDVYVGQRLVIPVNNENKHLRP